MAFATTLNPIPELAESSVSVRRLMPVTVAVVTQLASGFRLAAVRA